MGKIIETRKRYKETIGEITKSEESWLSFLDSSSWNFKYDFADQVLIYTQRPEAKACATMEIWNTKVKRWVNKDADFIFVFSKDENSQFPFELVFDVSDTHNSKGTEYKLWSIKPEYEQDIIETLESTYGAESEDKTLSKAIILNAYNMVIDNIQDYLSSIQKYKIGSSLENIPDDEIFNVLAPTVWASVSYMMMTRCGIDAKKEIDINEFSYIKNFNSDKIITILGTAISDIAEMGLREIARTVKNLQIEEKNKNHTFVKNQNQEYSNNKDIDKGGIENGENRIHESGRLQYAKSSNGKGETSRWQIRKNEVTLSKEIQESRIHNIIDGQKIERTSNTNTRNRNEYGKSNSGENGKAIWDNREIESTKSNGMDRLDEQLQNDSRTTSDEGLDLQLENQIKDLENNTDILTENEQIQNIAEVENTSVFSFTQEMIDSVLREGSHFEEGKFRIYEYLTRGLTSKENADFLKLEYGDGGRTADDNGISEDHSSKGIKLYRGYDENAPTLLLKWTQVEKRIRELISSDRYFNDQEKDEYYDWLDANGIKTVNNELEQIIQGYEPNKGDIVYIGTEEYEIRTINDEKVTLIDTSFPLLTKEIERTEFEKKIKENPANDKLRTGRRILDIEEQNTDEVIENIENKIEDVKENITKEEKLKVNIKRKRRNKIEYFDLHPEIPINERNNYKITNNDLGVGTPKEKYKRNIDAIKVLKRCSEENRYATPQEQEILAQYVGWGGLQEAFNPRNDNWSDEYKELEQLLTEKEYEEAKQSTLTAFYTPPIVIKSIYNTLENMGLERGNIIEPSCRCW